MVQTTYLHNIDMSFAFYGYKDLSIVFYPSSLLSWMFEHDCLDTCCFGCLICMCFIFLDLYLFNAIEHVPHGKMLKKYNHYHYYLFQQSYVLPH